MTDFNQKVPLGRTGLMVSRLGLGASYKAPEASFDEAFERGVNYFYWGSYRRAAMANVIRRVAKSRREELVVVVQSYARWGSVVKHTTEKAIRKLGLDYVDVLLLGWFNHPPADRVIDAAVDLQGRGRIKYIAISGHDRKMFPTLRDDPRYDIWHTRYNAVHRGCEKEVFPSVVDREPPDRPGVVTYTTTRWGHLVNPKRTPSGEKTPTGTDCYRFALSHPAVDVALAGPSTAEEMTQALASLDGGPMSDDELEWMRRVGDHIYGRDRTSNIRDGV